MKSLRIFLLLLSLLGLPLSGLAALGADCSEMAATAGGDMTGHAGHMSDSADPGDGSGSCPCCDGCAAACSTGCGNAVSASPIRVLEFTGNAYRAPGGARYVPDPAPPVLIRPPILPC